eukprot:8711048-Alexandrium_andersonii.AAC.1
MGGGLRFVVLLGCGRAGWGREAYSQRGRGFSNEDRPLRANRRSVAPVLLLAGIILQRGGAF